MLALKMLANYTDPATQKAKIPLVMTNGNTNVVNTVALRNALGGPVPRSGMVPFLTALGQMAWRYLPTAAESMLELIPLDKRKNHDYLTSRRMPEKLPGGLHYSGLAPIYRNGASDYAMRDLKPRAAKQAVFNDYNQRRHVTHYDHRIIGDYISVYPGQQYKRTADGAYTLPKRAYNLDSNKDIKDTVADVMAWSRQKLGVSFDVPRGQLLEAPPDVESFETVNRTSYYNSITPMNALSSLALRAPSLWARDNKICRDHNVFLQDGSLPVGTFFRTPLFHATLEPMSDNDFGQVDLSRQPFEITLNSRMAYPRVRMSMVHEMLHVLFEMHKINLSHDMLHEVALLIVNDVLPALGALAEQTNRAK